MLSEDSSHREWAEEAISDCINRFEYPPIIFAGSGLSQRYIDTPRWIELLDNLAGMCPYIDYPIEYYEEEYTKPEIATEFIEPFRQWAWDDRGTFEYFPENIFESSNGKEKYLKYKVAEIFGESSPESIEGLPSEYQEEINALQRVSPSAAITTNYDFLLETLFPGFEKMVGQEIYEQQNKKVGDLFKIHGCASDELSLVLTEGDYVEFEEEKKYISAKLLTYFTEHPVLILGHSASDENIKRILSELDKMVPASRSLIDNIYLVNYERDKNKLEGDPTLSREELIEVGEGRRVRVNSITAHSFKWIYDAFGQDEPINQVQIEQARSFASNIYKITTRDAPRKRINFERLEYFSDEENIEKLLGFVPIDNPETVEGLRQAGIPIGEGEVSTEQVEDINARLNTATQDYRSNGNLINDRSIILEFRKRIEDLNLDDHKNELLIKSSMDNRLQGADWILEYSSDVTDIFDSMIEDESIYARSLQRLEYTLMVMGETELLQKLHSLHSEVGSLKGPELQPLCDAPIEERLEDYGSTPRIHFLDDEVEVTDLLGNQDRVRELLNICTDILIEESRSRDTNPSNAVDFRKLELVSLANSMEFSS